MIKAQFGGQGLIPSRVPQFRRQVMEPVAQYSPGHAFPRFDQTGKRHSLRRLKGIPGGFTRLHLLQPASKSANGFIT